MPRRCCSKVDKTEFLELVSVASCTGAVDSYMGTVVYIQLPPYSVCQLIYTAIYGVPFVKK